jgi:hypothetical protein
MNLEHSAASLLEQFPDAPRADLQREEKMLERFGTVAFGGFGVVVLLAIAGLIYWIVDKAILSGEGPVMGILLIAFLIFAALSLAYVIWRESLKEKRAKLEMAPGRKFEPAPEETGKLLNEGSFESVPSSVVEDTTDLLPARAPRSQTRKLDD